MNRATPRKPSQQDRLEFAARMASTLRAQHPLMSVQQIKSRVKNSWQDEKSMLATIGQRISAVKEVKNQSEPVFQSAQKDITARRLDFGENSENRQAVVVRQMPVEKVEIHTTAKSKQIKKIRKEKKQPNKEFLNFQRFYKEKLEREHPRWTREQINQIISLLWKKHLQNKQVQKQVARRPARLVSGRTLFGMIKKLEFMTTEEIRAKWKTLPKQARNHWNNKALLRSGYSVPIIKAGPTVRFRKDEKKFISENRVSQVISNNLSFMRKAVA